MPEVAKSLRDADELGGKEYGGGWSGPVFVLTHRPPEPPDSADAFLTGDIGKAVATVRGAAGGKNLRGGRGRIRVAVPPGPESFGT